MTQDTTIEYRAYPHRWYILSVFSLFCLLQWLTWNTVGPIVYALQYAHGWTDGDVALVLNWAAIMFVVCLAPMSYLPEKRGLRETMIFVSLTPDRFH